MLLYQAQGVKQGIATKYRDLRRKQFSVLESLGTDTYYESIFSLPIFLKKIFKILEIFLAVALLLRYIIKNNTNQHSKLGT